MLEVVDLTKQTPEICIDQFVEFRRQQVSSCAADSFLTSADDLFQHERSFAKVFGKTHKIPRDQTLVILSDDDKQMDVNYTYSGHKVPVSKCTPDIKQIQAEVELAINQLPEFKTPVKFDVVLINRYLDGHDTVGWHCDNEPSIDQNFPIASVSLGATRDFDVRIIKDPKKKKRWALKHRDLLIMKAGSQGLFHHSLPRRSYAGKRINLTFRVQVRK